MQNRIILALWLLGHLVDLSQAESKEDVKRSIERLLPTLLKKGFQNAEDLLKKEDAVALNAPEKSTAAKQSHNRQANSKSKVDSACNGLGLQETARLAAKELEIQNIDKDIAGEVLGSISIAPSDQPLLRNSTLCSFQTRAATIRNCDPLHPYRLIHGSCNNINTGKGASGLPSSRLLPASYQDNVDKLRKAKSGADLPNPRVLTYAFSQINITKNKTDIITQMVKAWGQFLDHDITLTPEATARTTPTAEPKQIPCCTDGTPTPSSNTTEDCLQVNVSGDPFYSLHGVLCLHFVRSMSAARMGLGPRNQINQVTSFIDASQVYGSDTTVETILRDTVDGRMRDNEANEIPGCCGTPTCLPFLPERSPRADDNFFIGGDVRVNEQPGLTSMHTAFIRFHNIIAEKFLFLKVSLPHEVIYQETRRIVSAVMEKITYDEFLPIVLGMTAMQQNSLELSNFAGYNTSIDPSIANVFGAAAFRFGHSLVGEHLGDGTLIPLVNGFFDTEFLKQNSSLFPSKILKGETILPSECMDEKMIETLTNRLFAEGPNFIHGNDLMMLTTLRGRDHGLQGYNEWRVFCGLNNYTSFADMKTGLSSDAVDVFQRYYGHVDDVDLFLAGIAEKPVPGALVGPTFLCLLAKQFNVLKFGDRFWFENPSQPKPFTTAQLNAITATSLVNVLCETTTITNIQPEPMKVIDNTNVLKPCSSFKDKGVFGNLQIFL